MICLHSKLMALVDLNYIAIMTKLVKINDKVK